MKRYILMRTLRSLLSIFLVTTLTYAIVFTMVPRKLIFKQDPNYAKQVTTPDKKTNYENTVYERMGYIEYYNRKELQQKAAKTDKTVTTDANKTNEAIYKKYIASLGHGWKLKTFEDSGQYYAVRDIPIYERVWNFYANLIQIDHPWKIQDSSNPDLERYVRIENDKSVGWAMVGSGTEHKYLIYFNNVFPYIHQNIVTFDLGTSYPTYSNVPVLTVISQGQGTTASKEVTFPTGVTKMSSIDIYSRTYKSPSKADSQDKANFGQDDAYTETTSNYTDPSMVSNSFKIGIFGVILSYLLAIPLGLFMARFKDGFFDRFSTGMLTFMLAIPSVATIYIIRYFGTLIGLPDSFPLLGASDFRSYVLPAVVLGVLGMPGLAVWFRRYLVDEQNSDYVRFARAKGLSEAEISQKHLFKNAMVPIANGIPGAIIGVIGGATLTESIFAFPGMGKMMLDSIKAANNSMVVGLVLIFTLVSVFSLLAGDILMSLIDPRIKLSTKGGKK
ncbi:ABC transporter permease [Streptococcus loxodontisalivarius]|uniref:Oligopeptide transport system permease protein n=1 Tax=Streptococcus loxodontisalivarius TaxID=1349415 RepID=A0ABS2PUN8_9STRE|nr:ABC transporter permease [Streptococcus loxodontisalivarius]MBM7643230.1 oligopeptide transport system permease protein [Streptococcus loxodontisalivarius]